MTSRVDMATLLDRCGARTVPRLTVHSLLDLDHHLERLRFRGVPERLVRIDDAIELEAMRDEACRIDPFRPDGLEQHRRADRVDEPRGDGDVAIPKPLEMQSHHRSVNPDVGDGPARGDELLA